MNNVRKKQKQKTLEGNGPHQITPSVAFVQMAWCAYYHMLKNESLDRVTNKYLFVYGGCVGNTVAIPCLG